MLARKTFVVNELDLSLDIKERVGRHAHFVIDRMDNKDPQEQNLINTFAREYILPPDQIQIGAERDDTRSMLDSAFPINVAAIRHITITCETIRNPFELYIVLTKEKIAQTNDRD